MSPLSAAALAALLLAAPAAAQPPLLSLRLADAEKAALAHSPLLKAAEDDLASAEALVDVSLSQLVPRVTLDGSYQYQTVVPKLALAPNAPPVQFGDHDAYSIGPTLSYTLFDAGGLRSAWRSQKALAGSQKAQRDLVRRQAVLLTRLDYFSVQLALEQERSLVDSLRLAQAQYGDIDKKYRAGASSRIDWLSAHQQALDRRRDLRSSEASVSAALRALFAQTGQGQGADLAVPMDARVRRPLPDDVAAPTVEVDLEPLESVETELAAAASRPADPSYPQLLVYSAQAEAQRQAARAAAEGEWPRVLLSFKSDYEYPNMPLLESTWQNTAGVAASMPLFEFGRTRRQADSQRAAAGASESRRQEASDELDRDWSKARDQLSALRDEERIDAESVDETAEIARLRYKSYKDGGSTILDVETADVNAILARVTAAATRAQALIQLATLDSLSAKGTP